MQDSLRKENESNLLLHLSESWYKSLDCQIFNRRPSGKLREGIISSKREDLFALAGAKLRFPLNLSRLH